MTDKRKEMLNRVREKMLKKKGGKRRDPSEWRAPNLPSNSELKIKAVVLPPLAKGDLAADGVTENSMEGLFFIRVGDHWINKKPYPCPRVYDYEECPYCQLGFDLMQETDDKLAKREIAKQYLPTTKYAVNLYFPNTKSNPEDLRGTVKWYAAPSTIFDKFDECINNDDGGDDPHDQQPFGLFYDENNAYLFQIHITKNGEFNEYKGSKFLVASLGPIADTEEEIEKIMASRHDLIAKFPARTPDNLKALTDMAKEILESSGSEPDDDDGGFDSDEQKEEQEQVRDEKPRPVKSSDKTLKPKPVVSDKVDEEETVLDLSDDDDDELSALVNEITNA